MLWKSVDLAFSLCCRDMATTRKAASGAAQGKGAADVTDVSAVVDVTSRQNPTGADTALGRLQGVRLS